MKKYYQLKFATAEGKTASVTVQNARSLTPGVFTGAVDLIISSGAVKTTSGALTKFLSANFCEQTVTSFDMKSI